MGTPCSSAPGPSDPACLLLHTITHACLCDPSVQGHTEALLSVAAHPDGVQIVSGSCDWTVRVWKEGLEGGEASSSVLQVRWHGPSCATMPSLAPGRPSPQCGRSVKHRNLRSTNLALVLFFTPRHIQL
jgi:WD40 repeat protein